MPTPHAPESALDPHSDSQRRIVIGWLIGLRWPVFGFLVATLPLDDCLFGFHVSYAIGLPVAAFILALNALAARHLARGRAFPPAFAAAGVAVDLLAIGGILAASGGAANPFSAVFFVYVALAASILPTRTTFGLAALAACVSASLFALPSGACCPNHPPNAGFSAHLMGMWFAFVVAAALVAFFLTRLRLALEERGQEISRLRQGPKNPRGSRPSDPSPPAPPTSSAPPLERLRSLQVSSTTPRPGAPSPRRSPAAGISSPRWHRAKTNPWGSILQHPSPPRWSAPSPSGVTRTRRSSLPSQTKSVKACALPLRRKMWKPPSARSSTTPTTRTAPRRRPDPSASP